MTTQHILNVITPATSLDLMTLHEMKVALRIADTDTSKDEELAMIIDGVSEQIARMANRVFGYEEVDETFYDVVNQKRLYFSRWPVTMADIESFNCDGTDIMNDGTWVLEEKTGTLYKPDPNGWNGSFFCRYHGGYKLPDDAPNDLKRVAMLAAREDYYAYLRGSIMSGVRMVSHKHARVQYYPPGQIAESTKSGPNNLSPIWNAVNVVLQHYFRSWV